jgi:hypothetical protein
VSAAWIDKPDDPPMTSTELRSDDLYGAVCAINFADMTMRAAMSADFATFSPVTTYEQLGKPSWLQRGSAA